ncbi:YegP family protein [Lysobacter firmicutimachus]|uniref:YegP family protein n=1 Tax=Lysobacter firmicutimachus TaxID=1792846 RepID=A0AAU8N0J0_9GAMM
MAPRYVLSASGSHFRFVLKAGNGEIVLSSESYNTKSSALGGIESVRKNCTLDGRYERKLASDGSPMFNLKAVNGLKIGTSQMYSNESEREDGIAFVKYNGPSVRIEDLT